MIVEWTITSDGNYLFIQSNDNNYWKLEKNQISFKKANELVLIDRNGMHLIGIDYRRINGGFGSTTLAIDYLEGLVADASINTNVTIVGVSTAVKQDEQTGLLTDIKAFFTNTYNQVTNWFAVKVINTVDVNLPTGASTSAKQDTTNAYLLALNSLVPSQYDYISLTYTGANVTTVVYKLGGSGGTTVSTLTLTYNGSDDLTSVTKS
jgi:hypothetical protein